MPHNDAEFAPQASILLWIYLLKEACAPLPARNALGTNFYGKQPDKHGSKYCADDLEADFDLPDGRLRRRVPERPSADVVLSINGRRGTKASGKHSPSGRFVVFANSVAAEPSPGFVKDDGGYYHLFRDLVSNKILVREDRGGSHIYQLTRDYEFSSSSAAASVFLGTSASGPREWTPD